MRNYGVTKSPCHHVTSKGKKSLVISPKLYALCGSTLLTTLRTTLSLSKGSTLYAILLCLILTQQAQAAPRIIYVDNSLTEDCNGNYSIANRDCSGSDGDAYNTPQEAADIVEPGDTVYFRQGTYVQSNLNYEARVMTVLRSGTVDNPITFKNYNNEEVVLSGMRPGDYGHRYAVVFGIVPYSIDISGQGVQNIIIDGLIFEGSRRGGLVIAGPVNRYASAENPTENVIVRNCIFRNNNQSPPDNTDAGNGLLTRGKLVNVLIENCEAYNNFGSGIVLGANGFMGSDDWHSPEPDDDMSAPQYCIVRNCLLYNNSHPTAPGNTDGLSGSHTYKCTFANNVVFNNSDDGIDSYASIGSTIRDNIVFGHYTTGGNKAGIKFSAGGGGRHTVVGNRVLNNGGYSFEGGQPGHPLRTYYPSKIYGNLAYNGGGGRGFSLGNYADLTYPGFEKVYLRNNIGLDNYRNDIRGMVAGQIDSDYNFWSNADNLATLQSIGQDAHSLTGDAGLVNKTAVIDTAFGADWTIEQKLAHIRSQVKAAFSPLEESILVDAGVIIDGYHNPHPGEQPGDRKDWYGSAPDIGVYEYAPQGIILYGDVSEDSEISAYDAALTAQASVEIIALTAEQTVKADVSGDGEVSAYDAALIAQRAVGLIDRFPVEG